MNTRGDAPPSLRRRPARWQPGATRRLEPALAAATAALGLVAIDTSLFPTMPIALSGALLDEWLFWFMVLYLLLVGLIALKERVTWTGGVSAPGAESSAGKGSAS